MGVPILFIVLHLYLADTISLVVCKKLEHAAIANDISVSSLSTNPLSPNSDQHQISPCNINANSTAEVMRIKDMITQGEFLDSLITSSQYFYKKSMGTTGEFVL